MSSENPRLDPKLATQASPRCRPKSENNQIPENVKLLLKTLTPKWNHIPLLQTHTDQCCTAHGIGRASSGTGQTCSDGRQRTQQDYIPFMYSTETGSVSPARVPETTSSENRVFYLEALESNRTRLGGTLRLLALRRNQSGRHKYKGIQTDFMLRDKQARITAITVVQSQHSEAVLPKFWGPIHSETHWYELAFSVTPFLGEFLQIWYLLLMIYFQHLKLRIHPMAGLVPRTKNPMNTVLRDHTN